MRKGIVLIALSLLAIRVPAGAQAAEQPAQLFDTGTARDLGVGGAVTASGGDLAGVLWNPAGLAHLEERQVVLAEALRSFPRSMRYVGYGQPSKDGPPGALSYVRVDSAAYDLKLTGFVYTFAQDWSDRLSLGANMKLGRYEYPGDAKEIFSFDAGALYQVTPTVGFGLAVLNINEPKIRDVVTLSETDTQPALKAARMINAGVLLRLHPHVEAGMLGSAPRAYRTRVSMDLFDATGEVRRQVRFGVEHDLSGKLIVRGGLLSSTPTVGLGLRLRSMVLNGAVLFGREGHRPTESMVSLVSAF